jgi:hypothetical protein
VAEMTDLMVDIETMGTSPRDGMIQLSAIEFNYETGELGDMFDRCMTPLPFRGWNDGTRDFWLGKNRAVYDSIVARQEPGEQVLRDFFDWRRNKEARFWSKPLTFDWPFLADHLDQLGLPMPFHYRYARDLNSFMAGLSGSVEHPSYAEEAIENGGIKHNGLHDCAYQIDLLMHAKKRFIPTEVL